jgi:hypothetical protein
MRTWKNRFFVLNEDSLNYYKEEVNVSYAYVLLGIEGLRQDDTE